MPQLGHLRTGFKLFDGTTGGKYEAQMGGHANHVIYHEATSTTSGGGDASLGARASEFRLERRE